MAMIDDFKAKFPQFLASEVDAVFPSIESELGCYFNYEYADNNCINQALLYLSAHLYVVGGGDAGSGSGGDAPKRLVGSKAVGSVSVSYEASNNGSSAFRSFMGSTVYGQRFLMLTNKLAQGAFFV